MLHSSKVKELSPGYRNLVLDTVLFFPASLFKLVLDFGSHYTTDNVPVFLTVSKVSYL